MDRARGSGRVSSWWRRRYGATVVSFGPATRVGLSVVIAVPWCAAVLAFGPAFARPDISDLGPWQIGFLPPFVVVWGFYGFRALRDLWRPNDVPPLDDTDRSFPTAVSRSTLASPADAQPSTALDRGTIPPPTVGWQGPVPDRTPGL